MQSDEGKGVLYLCATPIGNLEDITLRALKVLREVDLVAAEDTRHTRKLFSHYGIHTALTSYHEHNRQSKGKYIVEQLARGQNVALVSDAGTPGVSDPGEELVKEALERGIRVTPIPGSSALLAALTVSGLPLARFVFEGFLPAKNKERRRRMTELAREFRTIVLYESPHRLPKTLGELADTLGDRRVCVARELTKLYEDVQRGTLKQMQEKFDSQSLRGELVLVIEGCPAGGEQEPVMDGSLALSPEAYVRLLQEEGVPPSKAIKIVARLRNIPRRELYNKINKTT
ncbi:16S rRNA (cytidine(1402)-2'-O)-methyltransferase [Desulfoscipio gibsoniae]|uniref:Ribosomal RNA small subunit methyltransferase I n=1 Tax=Desulfoscipio gibsoniae DSM 7213 TaxID=767817 RepID=R4KGR3_9FIRM|nr:16S rRNA (cytidine(1402)-2'-O)-methyltransferase [Desulfoscipio gibsoniae]AGK99709.1 putative S-adenosylmethionine-dependent methyltransferase, YraL family [Desulfoscipio gibsoniae DSM 7213]